MRNLNRKKQVLHYLQQSQSTCKFSASPDNFQTLTKQSSLAEATKPSLLQSIALIHLACAAIEPHI
jgi:hypothetical protein